MLDHGDGYMSLYGHNQTLLPNVGEVVRREEIVRLAKVVDEAPRCISKSALKVIP